MQSLLVVWPIQAQEHHALPSHSFCCMLGIHCTSWRVSTFRRMSRVGSLLCVCVCVCVCTYICTCTYVYKLYFLLYIRKYVCCVLAFQMQQGLETPWNRLKTTLHVHFLPQHTQTHTYIRTCMYIRPHLNVKVVHTEERWSTALDTVRMHGPVM